METNGKSPIKIDGITPEMAKKMLEANSKAMVSKLSKGSTLSKGDIAKLEKIVAMGETEKYLRDGASTWSELATALGISRRTLQNWRDKGNCPAPRKDGTNDVEAWLKFMDTGKPDYGSKKLIEARLKILNIEAEDKKHKMETRKGKYVLYSDVIETWSHCVNLGISFLRSKFENELPPLFTYDPVHNQKIAREAIDEYVTMMHNKGKHTP